MQYPLISEYIEAIRFAEDNFDKLSNLRPVLDSDGNPVMSSGNFAVVFKMKDVETDKLYAVKCFTREQEEREERYREIIKVLEQVKSPYFVSTLYYEKELFVDTSQGDEMEFPVLLMDWVEGYPIDQFIKENISNKLKLSLLAYNFCQLGTWLLSQPIAHGDIKPDNILIKDDFTLVLVDYDGMYVPAFDGKSSLEIGSPDFQHPNRSIDSFNRHIDDFSITLIALSLKAIAQSPSLYEESKSNALITSARDYADLSKSNALVSLLALTKDKDLGQLFSSFILAYSNTELYPEFHRLITIEEPLRSNVTDDDIKNSFVDENGVRFSNDKKRLIKFPEDSAIKQYKVPQGIEVICDWAFSKKSKTSIIGIDYPNDVMLPDSLRMIGYAAFGCLPISTLIIPDEVKYIGEYAFAGCRHLTQIILSANCNYLGESALEDCKKLINVQLPIGIDTIRECLLAGCESLERIYIPNNVKTIEECAFCACFSLKRIRLSNNIKTISKDAFAFSCKTSAYNIYKTNPLSPFVIYDAPYAQTDVLTIVSDCPLDMFFENMNDKENPRFIFEKPQLLEDFYYHKWVIKEKRAFSEEEKDLVSHAVVVKGQYGFCAKFYMKSGGYKFIPLTNESKVAEGDIIELQNAHVITLSKLGETDICRIAYNINKQGGKWIEKASRKFTQEELALVTKAQVVESQYGKSACFFMTNGTTMYLPMSNDAKSDIGDIINLNVAEIVTLEKSGEKDIQRIRG